MNITFNRPDYVSTEAELRHPADNCSDFVAINDSLFLWGLNINPLINRILLKMSLLENRFASWMPNLAGGSIILIAKKKPL